MVGTFNGLSLLNLVDGSCTTYTNFDEQGGLSHFSVFSAFVDNANTLWIGTYAGGVSYSNPLNSRFTFYDLQGGSDKLFWNLFYDGLSAGPYFVDCFGRAGAYFHWI